MRVNFQVFVERAHPVFLTCSCFLIIDQVFLERINTFKENEKKLNNDVKRELPMIVVTIPHEDNTTEDKKGWETGYTDYKFRSVFAFTHFHAAFL